MTPLRERLHFKGKNSLEYWLLVVFVAIATFLLFGIPDAEAYNANINGLKAIQDKCRATLGSIDKEILQSYSETTKLTPNDALSSSADQTLNAAKDKIERLLDAKREESLRLELIDKLIFKISEKDPRDLKDALPKIIDDIAVCEMSIGSRYSENNRALIPFLMNLATALRTRRETIENPLNFLENYIQYSSIVNPKPLTQFRSEGGYLNDSSVETKSASKIEVDEDTESDEDTVVPATIEN